VVSLSKSKLLAGFGLVFVLALIGGVIWWYVNLNFLAKASLTVLFVLIMFLLVIVGGFIVYKKFIEGLI